MSLNAEPELVIRSNPEEHLKELKEWLAERRDQPIEEMSAFFSTRVDGYEEHMQPWARAYRRTAELIPPNIRTLLDLGCGTGLELDGILSLSPHIQVTGIDLCEDMLKRLRAKHPGVKTLCGSYFTLPLGEEQFDAAVSVESFHHFTPEQKSTLYRRLYSALKPEGTFLLCDYIACCAEEETLMAEECARHRKNGHIPDDVFIHFDTPLTLEREISLLRGAGFSEVRPLESIEGATIIRSIK